MKKISIFFLLPLAVFLSIPSHAYDQSRSMVKVSGDYGSSFGLQLNEGENFIWKRANGDYQEENWRYIDKELNVNTYDPMIYDRYRLEIETKTGTPWNAFAEVKIDPWSFVGIGRETVTANRAATGKYDSVDIKYKYWEATGKTINETYRTNLGNVIDTVEQKSIKNKITEDLEASLLNWGGYTFTLSDDRSAALDYFFRPVRKLWVEYKEDPIYIKFFPMADQAEALTSDDPLHLSNNHIYYAPSPWLFEFDPGMVFSPADSLYSRGLQTKARWDWDLAWYAEDSNRQYLTFLRGATFEYKEKDFCEIKITAASPMSLWDYYEDINSIPMAGRAKFYPSDALEIGSTYTLKFGVDKKSIRAEDHVLGIDAKYNLFGKTDVFAEAAASYYKVKHANEENQELWGRAFTAGVRSEWDSRKQDHAEWDITYTLMTEDFSPGLADYRDTRADREWSGHIFFDPLGPEDKASMIGNSIDVNRYVVGANLRLVVLDNLLDFYCNYRNARESYTDKFIENTFRFETTLNPLANVQIKNLILHKIYPESLGNWDPFVYDRYEDKKLANYYVGDGYNTDITTIAFGGKVDFFEGKLSTYGIVETTNDPQFFPRDELRGYDTNQGFGGATDEIQDNIHFSFVPEYLYQMDLFDNPPYDFYNIWKGVVTWKPLETLMLRYTHVTNGNRNYAAQFDENHTHDQIEADYRPFKKIRLRAGYARSRLLNLMTALSTNGRDRNYELHHNLYARMDVETGKDQLLSVEFGEMYLKADETGVFGTRRASTTTSVLDTRKIIRVYYQGKF